MTGKIGGIVLKPKVFIGSSREGVKIADAIHFNLTHDAECTVWKDGVFQLSSNTLTALIEALRNSDFGVFVFSPDDITLMRNRASETVRDNVIFELGLFIGRLGQDRCFFLLPDKSSDLRLPSDLAGITPGRYESERSDENWFAALNPACMQIRLQLARLKSFQDAVVSSEGTGKLSSTENGQRIPQNAAASALAKARYYKKGILVTGLESTDSQLEGIGSWNRTLKGWIVPRSRASKLREAIPGLEISPATE